MNIILTPHPIEGTLYLDSYEQYGIINYKGIALTEELKEKVKSLKDSEYYEEVLSVQNLVTNLSVALEDSLVTGGFNGAYELTETSWIQSRMVHNNKKIAEHNSSNIESISKDAFEKQIQDFIEKQEEETVEEEKPKGKGKGKGKGNKKKHER